MSEMSEIFEKINIRGVNVANVTMDEAVEIAKGFINDSENNKARAIYTPNAEMVQACIDDKTGDLFKLINSADMVIPDGAGVVLASKILKSPLKQKVGGTSLSCNNIIPYLNEIGGTLFLLGSTEENVEKAVSVLDEQYKNLKVFYNNGFFNKDKDNAKNEAVIEKINKCAPDVVFVCLGALGLKQEKWIFENKDKLNAKLLMGLGGTIDVIAGVKKYAPKIFIKLNLEWFYYLMREPSRIKRYMALPKFVFGTLFAKKQKY
jgi:N-acetylglucosaminyldiphosphoundecaprenol N-acetyl-beta-D-mannosaminyltransferase